MFTQRHCPPQADRISSQSPMSGVAVYHTLSRYTLRALCFSELFRYISRSHTVRKLVFRSCSFVLPSAIILRHVWYRCFSSRVFLGAARGRCLARPLITSILAPQPPRSPFPRSLPPPSFVVELPPSRSPSCCRFSHPCYLLLSLCRCRPCFSKICNLAPDVCNISMGHDFELSLDSGPG